MEKIGVVLNRTNVPGSNSDQMRRGAMEESGQSENRQRRRRELEHVAAMPHTGVGSGSGASETEGILWLVNCKKLGQCGVRANFRVVKWQMAAKAERDCAQTRSTSLSQFLDTTAASAKATQYKETQ